MTVVDEFALVIPGKAHGQGRARSGQGRVYTPKPTREHAAKVQTEWIAAGRPTLPEGYHYAVRLVSYRARPASHYTSKGELSAVGKRSPVPGKPDCDNEIKGVIDALVACGAVPDDARCFDWHAIKVWAQRGEPERVWVEFDARWFHPENLTASMVRFSDLRDFGVAA